MTNPNPETPNYKFSKNTTYKIAALLVALIITNLILNQMIPFENTSILNADGSAGTADGIRNSFIKSTLLVVPGLGFVFGALLSFIPFKGMPFKGKWFRFSLIVMLVLYVVQSLSFLRAILN